MLRRPLGGSGYEKPQSALCAFVRFFSAKTSYTAGTLCAIFAEFFEKFIKNHYKTLDKIVFLWYN
jgi:hypothetical protein